MPAASGKDYIDRIDRIQANIWIDGEKVTEKISEHHAFAGVLKSQAKLYDLQHEKSKHPFMTYHSPSSGQPVGTSFLEPKTKEDLEKRRLMIQEWAKTSAGMLGRSPDYMNTTVMAFAAAAELLSKQDNQFTQNLRTLYENARENDWCFTHTFINPQVNRAPFIFDDGEQTIAAQTIRDNKDGIVIQGARLLATQGGITDEVLVFPSKFSSIVEEQAYGFSIPSNTEGLKFISRESFRYKDSAFDHPLGSRFDEIDTIVVFDNVIVPWDRVFFYKNPMLASDIYTESSYNQLATHQVLVRRIVKTEFILGVAQLLVNSINVGSYPHIHEKISEIIMGLEMHKALLHESERNASQDKWGTMVPDITPLRTAFTHFPIFYPRCIEILQLIGASGLVSIPTEKDFHSELKGDLALYLQGAAIEAHERVKLFRLAWDMSMSAFGTRQTLYERYFFGDPVRLYSRLYYSYSKDESTKLVSDFLSQSE